MYLNTTRCYVDSIATQTTQHRNLITNRLIEMQITVITGSSKVLVGVVILDFLTLFELPLFYRF